MKRNTHRDTSQPIKEKIRSDYFCELTDNEDGVYSKCYGYKRSIAKTVIFYLCCLASGGILWLVSHWKQIWRLRMTHSLSQLKMADKVVIVDQYNSLFVENVKSTTNPMAAQNIISRDYHFFHHKHRKYYFCSKDCAFKRIAGFDNIDIYDLTHAYKGIASNEREKRLLYYDKNHIDVEVKSYWKLFIEEFLNPFYIFQVFSCLLWALTDYLPYAIVIIIVSLLSLTISIYQTKKQLIILREMIAKSDDVSIINSRGELETINSLELVPGDLLVIPKSKITLLCDAVLVKGTAIVNESMLTGESLPVTKTALPQPMHSSDIHNDVYNSMKHKRHTLFCGTEILQTRHHADEKVISVVVTTGFSTMKGDLLRSILFPKPLHFQFFNDVIKFVLALGFFAFAGFCYSLYLTVIHKCDVKAIITKSLDIITITVPPSLPVAMTIGTVYALQRLKKSNIFCINPSRVNISGKIKLFCFDKTGTLTEEGLDIHGFVRANDFSNNEISKPTIPKDDNVIVGMATCHSLTIIDDEIVGDPLDLKMFEAADWQINDDRQGEDRYDSTVSMIVKPRSVTSGGEKDFQDIQSLEVAILKQYTFSSELQRMSVIVKRLGSLNMEVYAKGSPEVIASLCDKKTLPDDYEDHLTSYTKLGYRVLALARKILDPQISRCDIQKYQRSQAERNLHFLGFLIMKNKLKAETTPIIQQLYQASIRVVMVTGDNILTAASVARECGMVKACDKIIQITQRKTDGVLDFRMLDDSVESFEIEQLSSDGLQSSQFLNRTYHFAVTGNDYAVIRKQYPELYKRLLACGTIFARMLPDQKTSLIEGLQSLGYGVGMCGDGANDCGALKRAQTGISLSNTEASVASPFTSKIQNIGCVVKVIKEGRCALVTSFNILKYMVLYSIIQFITVLILRTVASDMNPWQYLYIDFCITTPFAITMSRVGPSDLFVPKRPLGRLMHPFVIVPMILHVFTIIGFQLMAVFYVQNLPIFRPVSSFFPKTEHHGIEEHHGIGQFECYENTILFTYANFQYVMVAVVLSVGYPYRQALHKNMWFLLSVLTIAACNCLLTITPKKVLAKFFDLVYIKNLHYYFVFLGFLLVNLIISYTIEHVLINITCVRKWLKWLRRKKCPRNEYKHVLAAIQNDPSWPPLGTTYKEEKTCYET